MKSFKPVAIFLLSAFILMTIESCERVHGCTDPAAANYNQNAQVDNGTCQYYGNATFYFDQNGPNATVTLNGQTQNVTANYPNGAPTCGTSATGCANFTLLAGTYNYTASSALSSWTGSVTINANSCAEVDLTQSTGSVTFWTANSAYGNITVTVTGGGTTTSGTITAAVANQPLCGAQYCASFNLTPGVVYSYSASATNGSTWGPSNVSVSAADACQPIQFTP